MAGLPVPVGGSASSKNLLGLVPESTDSTVQWLEVKAARFIKFLKKHLRAQRTAPLHVFKVYLPANSASDRRCKMRRPSRRATHGCILPSSFSLSARLLLDHLQ
jgi:hypothetical protein